MSVPNAKELINAVVTQWPKVTSGKHRFGGLEWRLGEREIGHIHGDVQVDIVFPRKVRDELVATGRANPHHIYPELGITFYLNAPADVDQAIELLHLSYDLIQEYHRRLATHVRPNRDNN